jgi:hypothetical protein
VATHDYVIANGTGAAVRSDLNGALAAIVSNNSGATEPGTMYPYQWWADTTTGLLKLRNSANNAWISLRELDGTLTLEDGTAAAPGLAFTSDLNTGLFRVGADQVAITTGGTSRLAVSTTAVSSTLAVDVPLGAVGTPSITFTGDLNTGIYSPAADTIAFVEGGAEAARIDSSARLLVGTTTARSNLGGGTLSAGLQLEGVSNNSARYMAHVYNANDVGYPLHIFAKSRGTAVGSNTIVQSGDFLGGLNFEGADGTNFIPGAFIAAQVDGTPGANDMPGRLVFSTTADGASSPTERMRIDSSGVAMFNTTSQLIRASETFRVNGGTGIASFQSNGSGLPVIAIRNTNAVATYMIAFNNNTTECGTITTGTNSVAYNTSSDYRLKENIVPISDGILRLLQLKPSRFNFKVDPKYSVDGFIAHEAQEVVPECATGKKDAVDDDGNPKYQGIDQSKLVPLLTAALQEAIAKIEALEARLSALEGN